ncbi:MAG: carboxypeptidase-like regulatory domain-containing protein, partial [Muribaculaceae bacterium]|nr:carboxypeptidase-like regulatory domain-containing protein [Muribaculaceae bacterium]
MKFKHQLVNIIITTATIFLPTAVIAQVKIHGKVTHGDGDANEPLEFVTVQIAGTSIGGLTQLDGTYSLSAPKADTIRVVFR